MSVKYYRERYKGGFLSSWSQPQTALGNMIVIVKGEYRLCQDRKWRHFANFGTFPECVKEYKRAWWAERAAKRLGGVAVVVPFGMTMDAVGNIANRE